MQSGKALDQGILYCAHTESSHFVLTDGRRWEIYESNNTTPVISFDMKENPARVCLKALALWRYSVESGQVSEAQAPSLALSPDQSEPSQVLPTEEITPQPVSVVPAIDDGMDWLPLSNVESPLISRPTEISFPDSSTAKISNWRSMLVECTRWMVNGGYLSESDCPIKSPYAHGRYIVHTSPTHSSGSSFKSGRRIGSLYIEAHSVRAISNVSKARRVIEQVGQDPSQFKVRIS